VILRRGSTRRFGTAPISAEQLHVILRAADRGVEADYVPPDAMLADTYVIANAVEGLAPGAYFYERDSGELQQLRSGSLRSEAGFLALGQDLARDAAVNVYWLADLKAVLARLGDRGYRAAQLDAAIAGGRAYLAAYALRLGATGLTFFDDRVTALFSPHAAGKSVMFLIAIGKGRRG
jgi:nitroreductase